MHIDQFSDEIELKNPQYTAIRLQKKNGGYRNIFIPDGLTLKIQRAILHDVESIDSLQPLSCAMAFMKNISILDNARKHLGNPYLIRYDIRDFFDSVQRHTIKDRLARRNIDSRLIKVISKWCFVKNHLPQGAATSPLLSNLACDRLDRRFSRLADSIGATFTRYADDIIITGGKNIVKYQTTFKRIIRTENFAINHHKTKFSVLESANKHNDDLQWYVDFHIITGLAVEDNRIFIRPSYLHDVWKDIKAGKRSDSLLGKIRFVSFIQPEEGAKLYEYISIHRT